MTYSHPARPHKGVEEERHNLASRADGSGLVKLAVFDFDGTLIKGQSGRVVAQSYASQGLKRSQIRSFLVRNVPFYFLRKLGVIDDVAFLQRWQTNMSRDLLRGDEVAASQQHFSYMVESHIKPLLRGSVIARLRQHQAEGCRTAIVSGTWTDLLRVLADELGIDYAVGSDLDSVGGRYTGSLTHGVNYGRRKLEGLERLLKAESLTPDWQASYCYADGGGDIPMLSLFGHPTAVAPDRRLAAHATANGWSLLPE